MMDMDSLRTGGSDLNSTGTKDAEETVLAVPHDEWDMISNVHLKEFSDIFGTCNSALLLDGVSLQEIMQQQISSPEYAFLFAGQTSIGDEKVSDEAIHLAAATLAAGYRGVWKKRAVSRIGMCSRFDETSSGGHRAR
jgi:hypothetical protein